jgi:hypothetical protein
MTSRKRQQSRLMQEMRSFFKVDLTDGWLLGESIGTQHTAMCMPQPRGTRGAMPYAGEEPE